MHRLTRALGLLLLFGAARAAPAAARDKAPPWLAALARTPPSVEVGEAHSVVLLDEAVIDVAKDGRTTERTRWAVRVEDGAGRAAAVAVVPYRGDSDQVRSFKAWLIRPSGEVRAYGKRDVIDAAVHMNALELYADARRQIVSAKDDAEPGAVFGFEAVKTENTLFLQRAWAFQAGDPVERSSLTVNLPPGWEAVGRTFHHPGVEPVVQGASRTWTVMRLPALPDEPHAPPAGALAPWLAVDLIAPADRPGRTERVGFETWPEVAAYFSPHYARAAAPDAALQARAAALAAGATTSWERIRALGQFAQRVNYISILLNSGQGGGMIPRPAAQVLRCNYGDCKDKATLLLALLQAQGIAAYPLIVYSGDPEHVREEWPSPFQFNHAILAIAVDDSVDAPAVVTHPRFGRLLCFDPTDPDTPPGWLAEQTMGGRALLLAPEGGGLLRLPVMPAEGNRISRRITAELAPDGAVVARIREEFHGIASSDVRKEYRERSATQYETLIQAWLARSVPTPKLLRVAAVDAFDDGRFELEMEFAAAAYGKPMRDVLLVFKPLLVARRESVAFRKERRTQPIRFRPYLFEEHTTVTLPAGYRVDEMIDPVELRTPFGQYHARATLDGEQLVFERSLRFDDTVVAPEDYESVRSFYEKILQTEQSPVVLERL